MNNKWNRKNALWMLLYAVLYAIVTAAVCVTGSIHPIFFVCYQITAGLLLSPILIRAFRRLIVITVLSEAVRGMTNYDRVGDVVGTVLMSFSSFGYYGQIWFNRAYTYECAIEEMPAGYGDTLMSVSPVWAFPVVVIIGIIVSVWIANVSMKRHKGSQILGD